MNQKLQEFSHQKSDYERPNLDRTNIPLPVAEQRPGDVNKAVDTNAAGAIPTTLSVPSLRSKRRAFTFMITALTMGFLLVAFNSPWCNEFLAPGPLSSPHAQLLAGRGVERCAACHGAASEGFAGWVSGHHGATGQSELCMKCHENTLNSDFALQPHGISEQALRRVTQKNPSSSITGKLVGWAGLSHGNEIACSTCHKEHHGNVSLSQLTDRQCQSCHSQNFHSFEKDHPEFNKWPQTTRQRLAFDHGTHLNLHFKNAKVEFNCNFCHVDDGTQKVKRMASFEQSCGNCHAQQIADSGQSGWTLFELPRLDMAAIEDLKLDVGNWPASATNDFDGELPPMMRVLLAGDADLQTVISQLDKDFSFVDIDADDADSVALAVDLVWGIKRLLHDLGQHGQAAIDQRLAYVMGQRFSKSIATQLLDGLNPDIFAATAKRWLPNIEAELRNRQAKQFSIRGRQNPMRLAGFANPAMLAQELLANNPLSGESFEAPTPSEVENTQGDFQADTGQDFETGSLSILIPSASSDDSELLATNPLKGSGTQATVVPPTPTSKPKSPSANVPRRNAAAALPKELLLHPEVAGVAIKSGWFRNDRLLKIGYRPKSHADLVVKSWSDCISHIVNADTDSATSALFAKVNSSTAAGNCRSCHTVSRRDDNTFEIAWQADRRDDQRSAFTKFSHRPHLTQWSIRECSNCHRMDETVSLVGSFESCDGSLGMSNFHPIVKADCASCHQKGRTESGCVQCHNYHVGHP